MENRNENAQIDLETAQAAAENEAAEMGLSRRERRELALKKAAEEAQRAAQAGAQQEPAPAPSASQADLFDSDGAPVDNSAQKIREQIASSREEEPEKVAGSIFDDSSIDGLEKMGTETPQNPTRKYTIVHENQDEGDQDREQAESESDLEETKTSLFGRRKSKAAARDEDDDEEDEEPKKGRRRSRGDDDEEEDEEIRPARRRRRRRDEEEDEEEDDVRPARRRRRGEDEDDDEDSEDGIDYDDYDYDDDDGAGHGFAYHLSGVFKVICIVVIILLVAVLGLNVWDYVGNRQGKSSPVDALRDSVRSYAPGVFDVIFPLQGEGADKPASGEQELPDEGAGEGADEGAGAEEGDGADDAAQNVG